MKNHFTKISLFILIGFVFTACNSLKRVPDGKKLLVSNTITVNGKPETNEDILNILEQKPNSTIPFIGYRLRLNLYNLAKPKYDSVFNARFIENPKKFKRLTKFLSEKQVRRLGQSFWYSGFNSFLTSTGEKPVLLDTLLLKKSIKKLNFYYNNKGYFDAKTSCAITNVSSKKAKLNFKVIISKAHTLDSIKTTILSKVLDSMYQSTKNLSFVKLNEQYNTDDFEKERSRITTYFRNNGVFFFQPTYVNFEVDTLDVDHKTTINLKINNYTNTVGDSIKTEPFRAYKISEVNIITDYNTTKSRSKLKDSVSYKNFNLYSFDKLKYKPKAITDAVFITKGSLYSDANTTLTSRYLSNLKVFNYPAITYKLDLNDSTKTTLKASIFLSPRNKYNFATNLEVAYSDIQKPGITLAPSVTIRNVFNGAETLEFALKYAIGASKDLANPNNQFFNVSEYGLNTKLNFPRVLMFLKTERIIPKKMIPSTSLSIGISKQKNIGLDNENLTGILSYNWTPKTNLTSRFDLFNIQFIKNINVGNYFNVYNSSYNNLNDISKKYLFNPAFLEDGNLAIDSGTNGFINAVLGQNPSVFPSDKDKKAINSINERKARLTENNLIFATNYQFTKSTKKDIADESFYVFKTKLESAGNFLSILANVSKQLKNQNGVNTFLEVAYSQYFKAELDYIKHWDLNQKKVIAFRSFVGLAVPYNNATSIPFSRSYFAGGANDNRAWQPYSLGPGRSVNINDFNDANFKIALNGEFRFNVFSQFNIAFFADAGNIWNVFDEVEDKNATFNGLDSLKDLALGTGLGFRYDFNFFVFRLDFGFKTYNPAKLENEKWLREINFSKMVTNIGINYPF